ncbi:uncharacterized protein PFL1_01229 [Pseudozyma flocculosa PF-1]|uniref:Dynamin GTPase domain-containing protein n=1 Tax=Pseudozyma flocculosa TaxID=84751 RepID=A0A5C3EU52_9BASI|nr:uncharacterized protein PFL1_01229 [Pseudozyma flocculosa PF-1]EPQ31040.1 hypothetical protein PFL1_01229 [Pseudozyma flocculosa PF-1]SPO35884.1 uncharacterized protein PSFLO_01355 [Pseudozyma flocculosa]
MNDSSSEQSIFDCQRGGSVDMPDSDTSGEDADWRPTMGATEFGAISNRLLDIGQRVEALNQLAQASNPGTKHGTDKVASSPSLQPVIRLPRLALLGNQSVGKSSLVEVISGVTLPRSMGTCTRGPIDITTRQPDREEVERGVTPWFARVTLKLKSAPGRPVAFGDDIHDQRAVAGRIRRASLALREICSGSRAGDNLERFLHASDDELDELEDQPDRPTFFTDRIGVEVVGVHLAPLRFTDLPGLVHNADEDDILTIKRMVEDEISDPDCLIVLCVSLAVDIATQSAFRTAASKDADGARTIGVFTMPDRMQADSWRQWVPVVEGKGRNLKRLLHGWHVIRCPSPGEDASATLADKLAAERRFFAQTSTAFRELCAQLEPDFAATRCGIDRLTSFLSQLLVSRLRQTIPACCAAVHSILVQKQAELAELQQRQEDRFDPAATLSELVSGFIASFDRRRPVVELDGQIKRAVLASAPRLLPFTEEEARDEAKIGGYVETPWSFCNAKEMAVQVDAGGSAAVGASNPLKAMYLDEVRRDLDSAGPDFLHRLLNLTGDFEDQIRRSFVEIASDCFRKIRTELSHTLSDHVERAFAGHAKLGAKVHDVVTASLNAHLKIEEGRVKASIHCSTASDDLGKADAWADEELARYKKARLHASLVGAGLRLEELKTKADGLLRALAEFGLKPCPTFPSSSMGAGAIEDGVGSLCDEPVRPGRARATLTTTTTTTSKGALYASLSQLLPDHPGYFSAELRAMALLRSRYNLLSTNLYHEICKARNNVLAQVHQDLVKGLGWELCGGKSAAELCALYFANVDRDRRAAEAVRARLEDEVQTLAEMKKDLVAIQAGQVVPGRGAKRHRSDGDEESDVGPVEVAGAVKRAASSFSSSLSSGTK